MFGNADVDEILDADARVEPISGLDLAVATQGEKDGTGDVAKALRSFKGAQSILEAFVDFSYEASVIAARGRDGSFAAP